MLGSWGDRKPERMLGGLVSGLGFGFPRLTPERPEPKLLAPVPVTYHPIKVHPS